jgi:glutathione synthase/RimK-type ligase-like ATP-grasp enzyme
MQTSLGYPIQNGILNIIDAIQHDNYPITIDEYGYYMWVDIPNGSKRAIYGCDYGINKNAIIHRVFDDKIICSKMLHQAGFKTPKSFLFVKSKSVYTNEHNSIKSALDFAESIGYPLIVKPTHGLKGRGVVKIKNKQILKHYLEVFNKEETGAFNLILQEFINWKDIRVIFLDGNIESVYQRIAAYIIGDGKQTIQELISEKDVKVDREVVSNYLTHEKMTLETVLKEGERVQYVVTANVSTGWEVEAYPWDTQDLEFLRKIAQSTGARYFGADILTDGKLADWVILELNKMPGCVGAERLEPGFAKRLGAKIWEVIKKDEEI